VRAATVNPLDWKVLSGGLAGGAEPDGPGYPGVVALASPYAESPTETRLRLLIVGAGLPRPEVQLARHTRLVDLSWQVYRYTRREVYGDRARIVAELARARARCT
jgi:hypothetical protein